MRHAIPLLVLLAAAACGGSPTVAPDPAPPEFQDIGPGEPVPFVRLTSVPCYWSNFTAAGVTVATTEEEWTLLRARLGCQFSTVPSIGATDFDREAVAVVALGLRGVVGFRVEVDRVVRYPTHLRFHATEHAPGSLCVVLPAVTAPVEVVRIPRETLPAVVTLQTITRSCRSPGRQRRALAAPSPASRSRTDVTPSRSKRSTVAAREAGSTATSPVCGAVSRRKAPAICE
jgi:hypothetical protein